ncbi:MAG: NUDIX domain-containing protein [Candidatus Woesearchaeota archaeon]
MSNIKIRKAVGAIVKQNDLFLLIHKIKMMNSLNGPEKIKPRWDFPKGGIKKSDLNLEQAILRELKEETGSDNYKIVKKFNEKIVFDFPDEIKEKLGFHRQEVTMFLVEFSGDTKLLKSQDDEIDNINFFSRDEVNNMISFQDSKDFFNRNI